MYSLCLLRVFLRVINVIKNHSLLLSHDDKFSVLVGRGWTRPQKSLHDTELHKLLCQLYTTPWLFRQQPRDTPKLHVTIFVQGASIYSQNCWHSNRGPTILEKSVILRKFMRRKQNFSFYTNLHNFRIKRRFTSLLFDLRHLTTDFRRKQLMLLLPARLSCSYDDNR